MILLRTARLASSLAVLLQTRLAESDQKVADLTEQLRVVHMQKVASASFVEGLPARQKPALTVHVLRSNVDLERYSMDITR